MIEILTNHYILFTSPSGNRFTMNQNVKHHLERAERARESYHEAIKLGLDMSAEQHRAGAYRELCLAFYACDDEEERSDVHFAFDRIERSFHGQ